MTRGMCVPVARGAGAACTVLHASHHVRTDSTPTACCGLAPWNQHKRRPEHGQPLTSLTFALLLLDRTDCLTRLSHLSSHNSHHTPQQIRTMPCDGDPWGNNKGVCGTQAHALTPERLQGGAG
jgi:hypothetical protein